MNSKSQNNKNLCRLKNLLLAVIACAVVAAVMLIIFLRRSEGDISDKVNDSDTDVSNIFNSEDGFKNNTVVNELPDVVESEKVEMLPEMEELYNQNPDIIGWIKIEGTKIDYPLMYTPDDEEKYLYRDFEGNYDIEGLPFLDKDCSVDPESDNLIFYAHNMLAGTMFRGLLSYEDEEFWKEHPTIEVKTLYETRTYEIIGAFRDRVYFVYEDCFKFYQFIDPATEEEFYEAISYFIENTPYDMDVTAEFGDNFITLVTCAYHHQHGRYVVVAREIGN